MLKKVNSNCFCFKESLIGIESKGFRTQFYEFTKSQMNKTLYDTYAQLNDTARNELKYKFRDSPVVMQFIDFVENKAQRTFKNREAVELLYKKELKNVSYAQLENRFFKLRKKLMDGLLPEPEASDDIMTEEEQELFRCKKMIQQNNKEVAYKRLEELEKNCWRKNIFELLPTIIDQLIFCNQSYNRLEQNKPYFAKQEKAIVLQADIHRTIFLARKIYEVNFSKGTRAAAKELEELRDLAARHPEYKRFALCYHHVSLYNKMGSRDYLESTHVISRHFREFKALIETYPYMPLIAYRNHYSLYQQFHYRQITAFYHYNRGEFAEAADKMAELWQSVQQHPQLHIFMTESLFTNIITSFMAAGNYTRAMEDTARYADFIKDAQSSEKNDFVFVIKAQIWCASMGRLKLGDTKFYRQKVEKYIRQTASSSNRHISHDDAVVVLSKMYFLEKDHLKAVKTLPAEPAAKTTRLLKEFYEIVSGPAKKEALSAFRKELNKLRFNLKKPDDMVELGWLIRALDII